MLDQTVSPSLAHRFTIVATDRMVFMHLKAPGRAPIESYLYDLHSPNQSLWASLGLVVLGAICGTASYVSQDMTAKILSYGTAALLFMAGTPPVAGRVMPTAEIRSAPQAKFMTSITYALDQTRYDAIRDDLLRPRPHSFYSWMFHNSANFVNALTKRHGLDLARSPVYFDSSRYMSYRMRNMKPSPDYQIDHHVFRSA